MAITQESIARDVETTVAFSPRSVAKLWLTRCNGAYLGLLAGMLFVASFSPDVLQKLGDLRSFSLPLSLLVLFAALRVIHAGVKSDVQIDAQRDREHQRLHTDTQLDQYVSARLDQWTKGELAPMLYQPKVDCHTHALLGAEALLRLTDANGQSIPAMRAISIFRKQGRLVEFEWATLQTVVKALGQHVLQLGDLVVSVNVSAQSLSEPGMSGRLIKLLRSEAVSPSAIKLEMVEWSEHIELAEIDRNVAALTEYGVRFSLDDFGVGYSSLMLMTQYSFNEVKLEHSLIATIHNDRSQALVKMVVEAAKRCHAIVVAEGIETVEDERIVRSLGVQVGQGFYYAGAVELCQLLTPEFSCLPPTPGGILSAILGAKTCGVTTPSVPLPMPASLPVPVFGMAPVAAGVPVPTV